MKDNEKKVCAACAVNMPLSDRKIPLKAKYENGSERTLWVTKETYDKIQRITNGEPTTPKQDVIVNTP